MLVNLSRLSRTLAGKRLNSRKDFPDEQVQERGEMGYGSDERQLQESIDSPEARAQVTSRRGPHKAL